MLASRTPATRILSQITNQTYNALHYRANANKSNETQTDRIIFASYLGSVASSVGTVLYIQKKYIGNARMLRFAPFFAVAAADVLNLSIIRHNEFVQGIKVYNRETREEVGVSRLAGAAAVSSCIAGRVAAAAPILLVPAYINFSSHIKTAALVATLILTSVPLTFGMFHLNASVNSRYLERHVSDKAPNTILTYYKGI
jgi:hypothetical protein